MMLTLFGLLAKLWCGSYKGISSTICLHMAVHVYITKDFLLSIHIVTKLSMQYDIIMSIKAHAIYCYAAVEGKVL